MCGYARTLKYRETGASKEFGVERCQLAESALFGEAHRLRVVPTLGRTWQRSKMLNLPEEKAGCIEHWMAKHDHTDAALASKAVAVCTILYSQLLLSSIAPPWLS
jgi:hypothetical protein